MADNLTLGRGEIHFAKFLAGTKNPGGERYFGNTPEFSLSIDADKLDHFSSDRGIKEKDASITLQANRTGQLTIDNISAENVAIFFFGSTAKVTQAAGTVTDEALPAIVKGLTYQLGQTPSNPVGARNLDPATPIVVKKASTVLVAGTDYVIDYVRGRLTILESSVTIVGGDTTIKATYLTLLTNRDRIISGSAPIEGAMRYLEFNATGSNKDWYFPYVTLAPNGDYSLKGDDWQTIPFNIEILKKTGVEAMYCDGAIYAS